jgi:S1-C subfamily serine protease
VKLNQTKFLITTVCLLLALTTQAGLLCSKALAIETWETLDKRIRPRIYQLNVAVKIRLKDGEYVHLADLSPKFHFAVFSTSNDDQGYKVVGFGSSFPITTSQSQGAYFITNRHVVESAQEFIRECERFYSALRLYAEQTSNNNNVDTRYHELLQIVNLAAKRDLNTAEKATYQTTADAIWDTYEMYLSGKADPARVVFQKYKTLAGVSADVGYFLHAPGPVTQPAIEAKTYKVAKLDSDPDLAILHIANSNISPLEFDTETPTEGEEIQVLGYPTASDQIDVDAGKYYAPTFNTGRISRVGLRILEVDAPITTGNSGGPVISLRGKVLGVVAVRAVSAHGSELPNFGGAITIQSVQTFAPELFGGSN